MSQRFLRAGARQMLLLLGGILLAAAVFAAPAIVEVRHGHVRTPVPGQTVAAAFMTLYNTTEKPQQLVAVKGDVAQSLELHGHTEANGIMQMRRLDAIALPPHTEVTLAPGGMHLMLIGLRQPLTENQRVTFKLVLGDGREVEATLPVVDVAHEQQDGGDAHHH